MYMCVYIYIYIYDQQVDREGNRAETLGAGDVFGERMALLLESEPAATVAASLAGLSARKFRFIFREGPAPGQVCVSSRHEGPQNTGAHDPPESEPLEGLGG